MSRKLPSSWSIKKIGELCDVSRGASPRPIKDQRYFEGGTIPWVKIADATKSGKYLYESKQYVNDFGASFSKKLPPGTILVAASGTLGYTQILGVEACAHDGWLILQNLRNLDKDFAYYTLQWMEQHFYNSAYGAAIQNINTEILRETEIPHPPLPTQQKIAAILSAYDELIENNTRRIAILEEMAQLIYQEWFIHFRFPGHEQIRMVDSELGPVPEGWEVMKLADLATMERQGINPSDFPEEIFEHYSIPAFDNVQMPLLEKGETIKSNKYTVLPECVLLSKLNPRIPRVWLPKLGHQHRAITSTEFLVMLSKGYVSRSFLYSMFSSSEFLSELARIASGTSTSHQRVKPQSLLDKAVLLPQMKIMEFYTQSIDPIFGAIANYRQKNSILRQTRDLLLPRLISGELDVSELDIDIGGLA